MAPLAAADTTTKPKERLIAKIHTAFIAGAYGGGIQYTEKGWCKGLVYLTDKNIYFVEGKTYTNLPLNSISGVSHREPRGRVAYRGWQPSGYDIILAIDYTESRGAVSTMFTSFISGPEEVINTFKHHLDILLGTAVKKEQTLTDLERRIAILIYTGVKDLKVWEALLKARRERLIESFNNLKKLGYVDSLGKLTATGVEFASKALKGR
jgi:helix-turn-helix protein